MMTEEYDDQNGRRVWLSRDEVQVLVGFLQDPTRRIAVRLGAECGLRSDEVVDVTPGHVFESEAGKMLQVPDAKRDKYRETPIPESLADVLEYAGADGDPDDVLVDVTTRTLRNWIEAAREELAEDTDDRRWRYLTFHDLRRTWAGQLANDDVDETVALRWGGWEDLETFLEHYRGEATAKAQARERSKVDWL